MPWFPVGYSCPRCDTFDEQFSITEFRGEVFVQCSVCDLCALLSCDGTFCYYNILMTIPFEVKAYAIPYDRGRIRGTGLQV